MAETFIAIRKASPQPGAELAPMPLPDSLGPQEVLIQVDLAAICASDVHVYDWAPNVAASHLPLPVTMGHEFTGTVLQTGEAVKTLAAGDRISGETHLPCGECYQCQTGQQHRCQNLRLLGRQIDGCMAEYAILPEICARRIPSHFPVEQAALMEPLGVAVHAVDKAGVSGETVAILGCGAIASVRVKALRRGAQDCEYLLTLGRRYGLNREQLRSLVARKVAARAALRQLHEDDAAPVAFEALDPDRFAELREGIARLIEKARP